MPAAVQIIHPSLRGAAGDVAIQEVIRLGLGFLGRHASLAMTGVGAAGQCPPSGTRCDRKVSAQACQE